MRRCIINVCIVLLLTVQRVPAWNTCSDEPFCDQIRNQRVFSNITLDTETIISEGQRVTATLLLGDELTPVALEIRALENGIFRFTLDDASKPRYRVTQALKDDLVNVDLVVTEGEDQLEITAGDAKLILGYDPLRISVYREDELVVIINGQDMLTFNFEEDNRAVALDFTFPGTTTAYGIPEHAEPLSLKSTRPDGLNPYRLFSADYPGYDIGTQEALYGAIPVLYAHGTHRTSGVFWLNSAQTFVDITKGAEEVQALFISETGILDVFVLSGPTLQAAVKQYTSLTGPAPLPQYHVLGHHQCRWSYMNQTDVQTVVEKFDEHELPMDVIWLDIDYTDGYRYFTWNYDAFPNPVEMQNYIASTGRRAVMIVDPHIKVDEDYFVWQDASGSGYFVKNPNGSDYQADCWPGLSSWIDFHNEDAVDYYVSLFSQESYENVTDIIQIWNDMNEPAVFDVEEKTFPRELVHHGNLEHREVHNMYGLTQTIATHRALLSRYSGAQRPFTLTRSHFAGVQRYSAVWTGDNLATWEHLRISFAMCLAEAISGVSFCGADVGGFGGNPSEELLQRWYQAGAWLPFYRAHSELASDRREPYLFGEEVLDRIREAIKLRYTFLPVWYTLFYEHERFGEPVIVPITYHYSSDPKTLDIDNEWLVGRDILVHPVAEEGATEVTVYLPGGGRELWFDISGNLAYYGYGYYKVPVTMDKVPVFFRGGSILPRKLTARASTASMREDPYSLYIFLDVDRKATGTLYIDDGVSFNYRNGRYNYYRLQYEDTSLSVVKIDADADLPEEIIRISSILVYGAQGHHQEAVTSSKTKHKVSYGHNKSYMMIEDLNLALNHTFTVDFV